MNNTVAISYFFLVGYAPWFGIFTGAIAASFHPLGFG